LALGIPHPDYLLECLTSKQLSDWEVFYAIEPFGEEADYYRTGLLCANLINIKLKKDAKHLTPHDFMPSLYEGERSLKKQTVDDMQQLLSSMSEKKEI
jgi:hypothetical protein